MLSITDWPVEQLTIRVYPATSMSLLVTLVPITTYFCPDPVHTRCHPRETSCPHTKMLVTIAGAGCRDRYVEKTVYRRCCLSNAHTRTSRCMTWSVVFFINQKLRPHLLAFSSVLETSPGQCNIFILPISQGDTQALNLHDFYKQSQYLLS